MSSLSVMKLRILPLLVIAAIFSGIFSAGCKSSSSTPSGPPDYGGNVFPKSGTTYNFHVYLTDSLGTKVPGSDSDYVASVTQSGINYMGKSNVFQVSDAGANNYYTYEHNGDVDLYLDPTAFGVLSSFFPGVFNQWYTFPAASHVKGLIVYDSTITLPILGAAEVIGRIDYVGEETITVGTESLTAEHCVFKVSSSLLFNYTQDVWFVSKIGYFVENKTRLTVTIPGFGKGANSGRVETMTSYSLK
ncbi:MAG TPA: hypothetical protein VEW28_04225 [Candidatus Kapabacteria bacterium]|nr:hypothetical protein [Candidatus Kapabacteria bacterium]